MRGRQTRTYQKPTEKISMQQVMNGAEMKQNSRQKESGRMENDRKVLSEDEVDEKNKLK